MKPLKFHKYERAHFPNGKAFYRCMEPGCSHFLPILEMAIQKESLCWGPGCNHLVTITRDDVKRGIKHPTCDDCKKKRKERREELMRK